MKVLLLIKPAIYQPAVVCLVGFFHVGEPVSDFTWGTLEVQTNTQFSESESLVVFKEKTYH